ncbi:MAG: CCA tRNA nucleotidyltransferase [Acidobacteriaceae bacterium]
MADYIYLLQTRLTPAQQAALEAVRQVAKARSMTIFLVGGAVRDLTSGAPIRDLDLAVQGSAGRLNKDLQKAGGVLVGEDGAAQCLYYTFAGGVRLSVGSTLNVSYPKPGKAVYKPATILDDLHRRDFTANAMALSLNDGSFGLLMDPLNGVADIENRELRLVSNYGFLEDPSRMIRAIRLQARLGWQMEEKTRQRYENAKAENAMAALQSWLQQYEMEEVFHEEDPLRVLRRLEAEGWAQVLSSTWSSEKADEVELERLRDMVGRLESMGIFPDPSAAYFPLLTAKLTAKEVASIKAAFARPGFAEQIAALEADSKALATLFTSKSAAAPSDAWKMLFAAKPEAVLWLAYSTKSAVVKERFEAFFNEWSQARQKIPYQMMQEMRITPALPVYDELVEKLFYAVMDGKLETPEAIRAFLEPYSPPAPVAPVTLRRRAVKREAKLTKAQSKKLEEAGRALSLAAAAAEESGAAAKVASVVAAGSNGEPEGKAAAEARSVVKVSAGTAVKKDATKPGVATAAKKAAAKPAPATAARKDAIKPTKKPAAKPVAKGSAGKPVGKKVATKPAAKNSAAKKPTQAAAKNKAVGKKIPSKAAAVQKGAASGKKAEATSVAKKKVAVKPASAKMSKPVVKSKAKPGGKAKAKR